MIVKILKLIYIGLSNSYKLLLINSDQQPLINKFSDPYEGKILQNTLDSIPKVVGEFDTYEEALTAFNSILNRPSIDNIIIKGELM